MQHNPYLNGTVNNVGQPGVRLESGMTADLLARHDSRLVVAARLADGLCGLFLFTCSGEPYSMRIGGEGDLSQPVFSPDGTCLLYILFDGEHHHLCCFDLKTGEDRVLTRGAQDDFHPVWAPDGSALAWCRVPKKSLKHANQSEIYFSRWPDFSATRLTMNQRFDAYPVFESDGVHVVYESGDVDGYFGLFETGPNRMEEKIIYDPLVSGNGIPHVWAGNLAFEACAVSQPDQYDVFVAKRDGDWLFQKITNWQTRCNPSPRFSGDGHWLAAHRRLSDGNSQIYVLPWGGLDQEIKVLGSLPGRLKLPRWNSKSTLLAVEDYGAKTLQIFDLHGTVNTLGLPGEYRGQQFMEIYNFDIY